MNNQTTQTTFDKYVNHAMKIYRLALILLLVGAFFMPMAFAANIDDLWAAAHKIIIDLYNHIAGISTILAGLMSSIAVIGAKMSNNQHKVDQAWDWLRRIWIAWAIINGIGAFIAYVTPLFSGMGMQDTAEIGKEAAAFLSSL